MNNRTYIEPSVKLIGSTAGNRGFYLWMKSRQWIIKDTDGVQFMRELEYDPFWLLKVPKEFYVGDELVECSDYNRRINEMNLQYNNSDEYLFEINGSCLFRDILFNVNKNAQWAQSNRFLFSILDKDQVYNPENYHISAEYKDVPEWEEQFNKYMEAIMNDPIVDHNRLEMPYSISSTFWYSINKKCLKDLLNFLKFKAPFFYEIYGVKMAKAANVEPGVAYKPSSTITQYITKIKSDEERSVTVGDTTIVDSKMALILYSQFIRQSDTLVSGFYNEIIHEDSGEFLHKVFKGNTTFMIHYVADSDKVKTTVSNRLCAFAMSSGTEPSSWSYFLNRFLPDDISPTELMNLLPCEFDANYQVVNCKFHDDVKFRNEGKEISNCPCPLVNASLPNALKKKERDNNKIGDAYYKLTLVQNTYKENN